MKPMLTVDFSLDLICPWCWIGLRNLQAARTQWLQHHAGQPLQIRWHAETLLPQIPEQGVPYQAFYEARLGGPRAVEARRIAGGEQLLRVRAPARAAQFHRQAQFHDQFAVVRDRHARRSSVRRLPATHRHAGRVQRMEILAPVLFQEALGRWPQFAHVGPCACRYLLAPERLNQVSKSILPRRGPGPGTSVSSSSSAPK